MSLIVSFVRGDLLNIALVFFLMLIVKSSLQCATEIINLIDDWGDFLLLAWKEAWFLLLPKMDGNVTWSRDVIWWNSKQPGCGCRVMETLSRGNGWKLMKTGGVAKRTCLIPAPLHYCTRGNYTYNLHIWNGTMFGDLDWPLNASRGFVSVSWTSNKCFTCVTNLIQMIFKYEVRFVAFTWLVGRNFVTWTLKNL